MDQVVPQNRRPKRPLFMVYDHLEGVKFSGQFGRMIRELGQGNTSIIYLYHIDRYGYCAVTKLHPANTRNTGSSMSRFSRGVATREEAELVNMMEAMRNVMRELECTPEVARHPHIVNFFGYRQEQAGPHSRTVGLVLEYMRGGSVSDIIKSAKNAAEARIPWNDELPTERVLLYSLHVGRALSFLHGEVNIVHRNIKTSTVLLTADRKTAKLGKFCFARKKKDPDGQMTSNKYPVKYSAPEVINETSPTFYGRKADVYSFAIVVCAMTQKREPFEGEPVLGDTAFREKLCDPEHPYRPECIGVVDPDLKWVIENGWKTDPEERPTMIEIEKRLQPRVPMEAELS